MCLARGDARSLICDLISQIKKTGGERQRSEGIKKLGNAYKYLVETTLVDWRDYYSEIGK